MHSASAGVVDVSPTDLETCVEMTYNVGYLYTNIDILNILFSPVIQHVCETQTSDTDMAYVWEHHPLMSLRQNHNNQQYISLYNKQCAWRHNVAGMLYATRCDIAVT